MSLKQFKEKALSRFTKEITDLFFCFIENDRELLQDYLRIIGENDLDTINQNLGRAVMEWFRLENRVKNSKPIINLRPKSKLIKNYTEHIRILRRSN